MIIAYLMFTMPFTVWTLRTFIANIPRELDEAALIDGCSRWQVFYKIILPLVAPGLIATGVYGWVLAWNEFVLANTLLLDNTKQTLMVYLLQFQSSPTHGADFGGLMAAATLTALPVVVAVRDLPEPHLGRAHLRRGEGLTRGRHRHRRRRHHRQGRAGRPPTARCSATARAADAADTAAL